MNKWWTGIAIAICVIAGLFIIQLRQDAIKPTIKLGKSEFSMRVARSEQELDQGLSGTSKMPVDEALLFVFPRNQKWGIWMKEMNYPIDIVWIDENKTVVHIQRNALPSSYPDTTFRPPKPAKYVAELKAGVIDDKRITIGSLAVFDSTKGTFE
ncbi:DUF192 domain-containing protein [Candidatus Saccharibacteria bacterium]|nr:DUF192 domain-containing protein [Candidatus Saccharibacteria bacterium]